MTAAAAAAAAVAAAAVAGVDADAVLAEGLRALAEGVTSSQTSCE